MKRSARYSKIREDTRNPERARYCVSDAVRLGVPALGEPDRDLMRRKVSMHRQGSFLRSFHRRGVLYACFSQKNVFKIQDFDHFVR